MSIVGKLQSFPNSLLELVVHHLGPNTLYILAAGITNPIPLQNLAN